MDVGGFWFIAYYISFLVQFIFTLDSWEVEGKSRLQR